MSDLTYADIYPETFYALKITYRNGYARRRFYVKSDNARKAAEKYLGRGLEVSLELFSSVPYRRQVHPSIVEWSQAYGVEVTTGLEARNA